MTVTATRPEHLLWEERYRPSRLAEVIIPEHLKNTLLKSIQEGGVPSMLFYSPSPGTGKTTVAKAVCEEQGIKPLFINASMDNSIEDIRVKVVQYATTASLFNQNKKVVILDEGERLSVAAQDSLKGLVEQVSSNCSFIITCNAKSRIIEPLRSRCDEYDFVYSNQEQVQLAAQMCKRVFEILALEGVTYDQASVIQILKTLQVYAKGNDNVIDAGILGRLAGADTAALIEAMKAKKYDEVKTWCVNNFERLGDDFYGKTFKTFQSVLVPQSIPQAILILNDYQRHHATVPDRYVHFLALMTTLMMETSFKA
jgi:replication-associated recombination protein RarA